jgi:hypothetical protein
LFQPLAVLVVIALLHLQGSEAAALELRVDDEQSVTLRGSSDSVKQTVVDLCQAAGVRLVAYDAPDRTTQVNYSDIPLHRLIERLLRNESYMVGLASEGGEPRVAWLRVIGPVRGDLAVASVPGDDGQRPNTLPQMGLDDGLVSQALSSANAMDRAKATKAVVDAFKQDPQKLEGFLGRNIGSTANELAGQPFAIDLLNSIKVQELDMSRRLKLDAIIKTLRVRESAAASAQE